MRSRCYDQNNQDFKYYGARGISVCDEWRQSFVNFRTWAYANGYTDDLTIERKQNDGNYCPENCCWITHGEQTKNKRKPHVNTLVAFGESKKFYEWTKDPRCSVGLTVLKERLATGWTLEAALSTPPVDKKKKHMSKFMRSEIVRLANEGVSARQIHLTLQCTVGLNRVRRIMRMSRMAVVS